jgi:HK97 family phage major capsid protein
MASRLSPGAFGRSVWMVHSSVVAQLFVLVERVANAAGNEWVGGISPGWFSTGSDGSMTLMGRPLVITDRLQPLGTVGDIVLADLTEYLVGQVGEMRLAVDTSVGFASGEIYYKATMRVDGQPAISSAITPRRGSDSLSPFVKLATRS